MVNDKQYMDYLEQTKSWGQFQEKVPGRGKYWALNISDSGGNSAEVILIKQRMPMGKSWLWCPRGPQFADLKDEVSWENFMKEAKKIAKEENAIFLRVEPPAIKGSEINWPKGFKKAHGHYLPEHTLIVDLKSDENEILAQMKPKGRYNIRLADKKEVKVRASRDLKKDVASFYSILKETTQRDKFKGHPQKYYEDMLNILKPQKMAELFIAEHEGDILGGLIATFYNQTATYYFGASSNNKRNLMAPYLLQWEAMREAKKRGCTHYDFLGIAPENAPKSHEWAGITGFKRKFGGEELAYEQAKEYIFKPAWFQAMKLYKKLR